MKERPPHLFTVLPWSWPSESLLHRGTKWFVWMVHLAYNTSVSLREVVQGRALRREESAHREIEITLFFFFLQNVTAVLPSAICRVTLSHQVKSREGSSFPVQLLKFGLICPFLVGTWKFWQNIHMFGFLSLLFVSCICLLRAPEE